MPANADRPIHPLRRVLRGVLAVLAALWMVLEEWLWDSLVALTTWIARLPPLKWLERGLLAVGVVLALAAGFGVGIAGLGLGVPSMSDGSDERFWSVFFLSSVGGFATVMGVLFLTWRRARAPAGSAGRASS